jgi:hypothetical protein
VKDVKINIDGEKPSLDKNFKSKRVLQKWKSFPNGGNNSYRGGSRSKKLSKDMYSDILQIDRNPLPKEEVVGVITMEDVIEELLQVQVINFCLISELLQVQVTFLSNNTKYLHVRYCYACKRKSCGFTCGCLSCLSWNWLTVMERVGS